MAKVYIVKENAFPMLPVTWALYRHGVGPGRAEGQGFTSVAEAKRWAKKWHHEIVPLKKAS